MTIDQIKTPNNSQSLRMLDEVATSSTPTVARITQNSITTSPLIPGFQAHSAALCGDGKEFDVLWVEQLGSPLFNGHPLVTLMHMNMTPYFFKDAIIINRLEALTKPDLSINIFGTAPSNWFDNIQLRDKAIKAWHQLDEKNKLLLNAILFDGVFFKQFCEGPSSTSNHHAYRNGNLEHTLEVIEIATGNCVHTEKANLQLALIFAWLHDIGKAEEYQPNKSPDKKFKLTSTGYLHGHQMTGFYKLLEARAKYAPEYPESSFSHLRHLMSAQMSNEFTRFRNAQLIEYDLVQLADILSAKGNLHKQAFCGLTFGKHPHMGNATTPNFRYEL